MVNRRNYYRILHVQPDAPTEIIKSSFRTLMQRLKKHPDLGGNHWNAALINEAYRVLMNPQSREQYDLELKLFHHGLSTDKSDEDAADETVGQTAKDSPADTVSEPDTTCLFCLAPNYHSKIDDPDAVCPNCASPIRPASEWRLEHCGQRAINRVPTLLDIVFYTTWPQPTAYTGKTLDMSPNGMRFMSERRIGEGRRVKIFSSAINAVAVVTNCQRDTDCWIVGVKFETLRLERSQGAFFFAEA
ncbi:MAG: DnaJ domain-containing protein [Gammaproteobacteria bacterium]|nr:DnaJ domain-containing protein [Gammaproteobacteria bacterium]